MGHRGRAEGTAALPVDGLDETLWMDGTRAAARSWILLFKTQIIRYEEALLCVLGSGPMAECVVLSFLEENSDLLFAPCSRSMQLRRDTTGRKKEDEEGERGPRARR